MAFYVVVCDFMVCNVLYVKLHDNVKLHVMLSYMLCQATCYVKLHVMLNSRLC